MPKIAKLFCFAKLISEVRSSTRERGCSVSTAVPSDRREMTLNEVSAVRPWLNFSKENIVKEDITGGFNWVGGFGRINSEPNGR